MKALTLWQPWAWTIVHGPKRVENRPWKPWPAVIGKTIAIHTSGKYHAEVEPLIRALGVTLPPREAMALGVIIGMARVVGFVHRDDPADTCGLTANQLIWFFGPYGWLLDQVAPLAVSIPCTGALGLWETNLLDAWEA